MAEQLEFLSFKVLAGVFVKLMSKVTVEAVIVPEMSVLIGLIIQIVRKEICYVFVVSDLYALHVNK